jgi:Cell wall-associated hydrolases (invasion-associated proteins)
MHDFMILGTRTEMMEPEFWIEKIPDSRRIILDPAGIERLNKRISDSIESMCDLQNFKEILTKDELSNYIKHYSVPEKTMYDMDDDKITGDFYEGVKYNTNIDGINDVNPVRYGIAVKNAAVRTFPTEKGIFEAKDDREFDMFQETGCQALQPVLVLHESRDGLWYFIQLYNYNGWVKKSDIAIGDKNIVFNYANNKDFLIVTGNHVLTKANPFEERVSRQEFDMGTRIPLETGDIPQNVDRQCVAGNFIVLLPVREEDGSLSFKHGLISKKEDVTSGYLSYTRENVLKQVFKLIGDRYGWGDSFRGRDCSSTVLYVYKTFGILLPRNASQQEAVQGRVFKFEGASPQDERNRLLSTVKPCAGLYMKGHAMMYLGEDRGVHYMIHNFHRYCVKEGQEYKIYPANEVAVTSSLLLTTTKIPFIETFTAAVEFE